MSLNSLKRAANAHATGVFKYFISRRFWNLELLKWAALFLVLIMSAVVILMYYKGAWSLGKWEDGSAYDLQGNLITSGPGPGQWRFKQMLITFLGGGALAFAGVLLQKVTRNNLAEVSILGIGSINIMFIFAYVLIFKGDVFSGGLVSAFLPIITIAASILGTLIIWLVARSKRANKNTFVIIGIALQLLFESIAVIFVNPNTLTQTSEGKEIWGTIKNYSMGYVNAEKMPFWLIILAAVIIAAILVGSLFMRRKLDIYESNPSLAKTLGVNVERLKLTVYILVAFLAGIEASILGNVALLGIVAPSFARLLFKNKFAPLALASFILGGSLVMIASVVEISIGTGVPTGILATAISVPYFLILIVRGK